MQNYIDQLDAVKAKTAKSKLALANKLGIAVTATVIDEHEVFVDVIKNCNMSEFGHFFSLDLGIFSD